MTAVAEAISEKPILFSGAMVRAILVGTKTQTRRIVRTDTRPQTEDTFMRGFPPNPQNVRFSGMYAKCDAPPGSRSVSYRVPCPYGWLGERLWCRETSWFDVRDPNGVVIYDATPEQHKYRDRGIIEPCDPQITIPYLENHEFWKRRPSIFMPRWASRLTLEIAMVGVERLQDISEEDAEAEGAHRKFWITSPMSAGAMNARGERGSFRDGYKDLWESINGAGSWAKNSFVWVIDFKRV